MKILIVEDDENKRNHLTNFIMAEFPDFEISTAKSYQSGLRALVGFEYELVLLDMTMPTFDIDINEEGGRPQAYAGRELLRQMRRRNIETPVLIVTQFDKFGDSTSSITLKELDLKLKKEHQDNYLGAIYYNVTFSDWKKELKRHLVKFGD